MWSAVIVNELLHDFADLRNEKTTWDIQYAQKYFIAGLDCSFNARGHGFTLDNYKDAQGRHRLAAGIISVVLWRKSKPLSYSGMSFYCEATSITTAK